MDKKAFYDSLRPHINLTTENVMGIEKIIDYAAGQKTRTNDVAYILATAWWETAQTVQPIHERGPRSYFKKYEPGTRIGKRLGNKRRGDGYKYRGRGLVQLTGLDNYKRASKKIGADLVGNPDAALDWDNALAITFIGMNEGWFTSRDLDDYIDDIDESDEEDLREFINARRIINGTDKARIIGNLAIRFERALKAGGYPKADHVPLPRPKPKPPTIEVPPAPPPNPKPTFLSILAAFIGRLFRRS